jgi:hypothetical protein
MMMVVGKVGVPKNEGMAMMEMEMRDLSGWKEAAKFCPS